MKKQRVENRYAVVGLTIALLGAFLLITLSKSMAQGSIINKRIPIKTTLKLSTFGNIALDKSMVVQSFPYNSYNSADFFFPPYYSESDRIGYGRAANFDTSSFNAGWYTDWNANINPAHPGAAEYIRTIYFHIHDTGIVACNEEDDIDVGFVAPATTASQVTANLTDAEIVANVQKNPGALWIIGNEPDAPYNGSPIEPTLYAELYYHYYTTIKDADPTAKVAIGAVSQPSPTRRVFLDKILTHYKTKYGQDLPTDLWNIHSYYLNEQVCQWGVSLPPSGDSSQAWVLTSADIRDGNLINLQEVEAHIRDFRQWMYDRGYGNIPLIITEYGVLPPPEVGGGIPYSNEKSVQFLYDTSNMFRTITDSTIGYTSDGRRLVQMWNWFSTYADGFGGNLFDEFGNVSIIGQAFSSETNGNFTPYTDLQVIAPFEAEVTDNNVSLRVFADNQGNSTAISPTMNYILNDYFTSNFVSSQIRTLSDLPSRYTQIPIYVDKTWVFTPPVAYTATVSLGSTQQEKLLAIYPDLSVDNFEIPAVINWRKSGVSEFISTTITLSTTIKNVGTWDSVLTPMAIQLQYPNAITTSHVLTVPILVPQATFIVSHTWVVSDTGLYEASVFVNHPYEATRELFVDNNGITKSTLVPIASVYLPLINR